MSVYRRIGYGGVVSTVNIERGQLLSIESGEHFRRLTPLLAREGKILEFKRPRRNRKRNQRRCK